MKTIIVMFGEMGSGKNYHGTKLAKERGYEFLDGDDLLPQEMKDKVANFKPLDRESITQFVNNLGVECMNKLKYSNGLVLAQALYSDSDRKLLASMIRVQGISVQFVWVKPSFAQNIKQIYSRKDGFKWALYWLINKPFFKKPTHFYNIKK